MQSWMSQGGTATSVPLVVPGFAGAPLAATPSAPLVGAAPPAVTGVKPLKSRLDSLLEARATLASNSHCGEALATMDGQIARARADLHSAQPLEVALKGTLGAVAAARHALQRADAKTAKLEQQVVTAVTAYEAAAAESQLCRKQLAEAEAAPARTAGGHVDLYHMLANDPGAAWAAFRSACEARCAPGADGVDDSLRARAATALCSQYVLCSPFSRPRPLLPSVPPMPSMSLRKRPSRPPPPPLLSPLRPLAQ